MTPYQGNPRWTAYPDPEPDQPVRRGGRVRRLGLLGVPAVATLTVGLGAGAAYGYFSSHGSGNGSATIGTMSTVTLVAVSDTPSTPLVPGGTGDVVLEVNNPNTYSVTLVSVTGNGTITADAGHSGCTTTGVTFSGWTGSQTIPASASNYEVDLTGKASMSTASLSACQGATFSIPVTISVQRG